MKKKLNTLSVIAPVFNEEANIYPFYKKICSVLKNIDLDWKILFINDGSTDNSYKILKELSKKNSHVQLIQLTKNFGKENAITAGLDSVNSDATVIIDTDLQDPPELILEMIKFWHQGYDVIYAKRRYRKGETWLKLINAKLFYYFFNKLSDTKIPYNVGDYRLLSKRVLNDLKKIRERNRFMKGIFSWVGYSSKEILFDRDPRHSGKTSFNFIKLLNFALDGVTSFSSAPLRLFFYLGIFLLILSFFYAFFLICRTLYFGIELPGYSSITILILTFGGLNMFGIGLLGEYISRIYQEVKQRPLYLIENEIDKE